MATAAANSIRAGILSVLQSDLPAILTALDLPQIATWESKRREVQHTAQCPAIAIRWNGFAQGNDEVGIAQSSTYVERQYRFVVVVAVHAADVETADERLAAYADAVAAVLDDYDNMTLGGAAEDVGLAMTCSVTPGLLNIEGFSERVRAAGIEIQVKRGRTVGSYT